MYGHAVLFCFVLFVKILSRSLGTSKRTCTLGMSKSSDRSARPGKWSSPPLQTSLPSLLDWIAMGKSVHWWLQQPQKGERTHEEVEDDSLLLQHPVWRLQTTSKANKTCLLIVDDDSLWFFLIWLDQGVGEMTWRVCWKWGLGIPRRRRGSCQRLGRFLLITCHLPLPFNRPTHPSLTMTGED